MAYLEEASEIRTVGWHYLDAEQFSECIDSGRTMALVEQDNAFAELSRLGRNMFEVINIINQLSEDGVKIVFVRQPELSTAGPHGKLLLAIYSYFAEAERDFISVRIQQGLAAARARGKHLGLPKGSRDKERVLDPYREQIKSWTSNCMEGESRP